MLIKKATAVESSSGIRPLSTIILGWECFLKLGCGDLKVNGGKIYFTGDQTERQWPFSGY